MNTKLLMTASAIVMGITGVILTFLPQEVSALMGFDASNNFQSVILQVLGALYFAFAMVNWTAKANLIGGIYGRPVAIGNLTHFTIGGLALLKGSYRTPDPLLITLAIAYILFAILFSIVFFTHPAKADA
jgi:hypothetical protein